jgi:hypothetical protein
MLATGLLLAANVRAEELFYSATGPGYYPWDDAAGWIIYNSGSTPYGQLPTINDNVRINAATLAAENGNALTITNGVFAECNMFAAGDQNYPSTAWFRLDGGSLTCLTHFVTGRFYPGLATLESGSLYGGGTFYICSQAGSTGIVTNNGATVDFNLISFGHGTNTVGAYVQNGGRVTSRSEILIGNAGRGAATLNGGTFGARANLVIGNAAGGNGALTNNGASVTAGNILVGYTEKTAGRLVHKGGSLNAASQLQVGRQGGVGVFEADAPFTATTSMTIGTIAASGSSVPGTGTVTMAENAVGTVGEYLRVNNGDLFMRGGAFQLQNVGNPNRTNFFVRTGESSYARVSGWGFIGYTNENITLRMLNNGQVIADGRGVERDLNLNMIAVVNTEFANGPDGTNGWYAVNKGRLVYPRSMTVNFPANTPTTACCGDLAAKTVPGLVNSLSVTMKYTSGGTRAIRTVLCAPDRTDIPPGLPASLNPIGVWQVGSFSMLKTPPFIAEPFIECTPAFRYDRTKLTAQTVRLRLYRHDGSAWVQVGACVPDDTRMISADAPLAPLAAADFNIGWFAVMAVEPNGTLISIQ